MHRHTRKLRILLVAIAVVASTAALAQRAWADNPWHNSSFALDVDDNHLLQPRDVLLIINQLQAPVSGGGGEVQPQVDLDDVFYWDTSDNGMVTPLDAILVINGLLAPVPEPDTFLLAGLAAFVLAGYAWRRRRATSLRAARA